MAGSRLGRGVSQPNPGHFTVLASHISEVLERLTGDFSDRPVLQLHTSL